MPLRQPVRATAVSLVLLAWFAAPGTRQVGAQLDPIVYTLRAPEPETNVALIEARFAAGGRTSLDLMLPVWSPGYYGIGDYARFVQDFQASSEDGRPLSVEKSAPNHWLVTTAGSPTVVVRYAVQCRSRFVTGSWVGPSFAVINGPSTFITLTDRARRPHEIHLELPPAWPASITSLEPAPDGQPHHYRAPDYDVFIDSPIVAGSISTHEFSVGGTTHVLADFGELGEWDGEAAAGALSRIVEEHRRMLGGALPFRRYVFLNAFRGGAGGLEHLNSSLLSSAPNPQSPEPTLRWLKYVSHEYFHAINVKRLRPIELGPFDYERLPRTTGLWIAEGLTTYYGDLAVVRSGVGPPEDFLAGLSNHIRALQTSPGRLVQTLEEASLAAGVSSRSGIGGDRNQTVSYYDKGPIVGLLLDAQIRRATNGARSLDDGMRLAIARYSGAQGYTAGQFQATMSEVAGTDLSDFFLRTLASTEELDYTGMLDWFGLQFVEPGSTDPARAWALEVREGATASQRTHFARLLASTGG